MRCDKNGKMHTLEMDIKEIWELHGWELIEESVPRHAADEPTRWIIVARPKEAT